MIRVGKVRNVDEVKQYINSVKNGLKGVATEAVAEYIIGNEQHGLQHYPPMRSWYTHTRTYATRFGWQVKSWGDGVRVKIVNTVEHAIYPYTRWAGSPWGWRTIPERIKSNIKGAIRHANSVVNKFIKMKG